MLFSGALRTLVPRKLAVEAASTIAEHPSLLSPARFLLTARCGTGDLTMGRIHCMMLQRERMMTYSSIEAESQPIGSRCCGEPPLSELEQVSRPPLASLSHLDLDRLPRQQFRDQLLHLFSPLHSDSLRSPPPAIPAGSQQHLSLGTSSYLRFNFCPATRDSRSVRWKRFSCFDFCAPANAHLASTASSPHLPSPHLRPAQTTPQTHSGQPTSVLQLHVSYSLSAAAI